MYSVVPTTLLADVQGLGLQKVRYLENDSNTYCGQTYRVQAYRADRSVGFRLIGLIDLQKHLLLIDLQKTRIKYRRIETVTTHRPVRNYFTCRIRSVGFRLIETTLLVELQHHFLYDMSHVSYYKGHASCIVKYRQGLGLQKLLYLQNYSITYY